MMLFVSAGAAATIVRGVLPIVPKVAALLKRRVAPEPAVRASEVRVRTEELIPVPPVAFRNWVLPPARVTAPRVSVESVCARP